MGQPRLMPKHFQQHRQAGGCIVIVIDDQDSPSVLSPDPAMLRFITLLNAVQDRQPDDEFAAPTKPLAVGRHGSSMHFYQSLDQRQSNPQSATRSFNRSID